MVTVLEWLTGSVAAAAQNKAIRYTIAILILFAALCVALALALSTGAAHGPLAGGGTIWVR